MKRQREESEKRAGMVLNAVAIYRLKTIGVERRGLSTAYGIKEPRHSTPFTFPCSEWRRRIINIISGWEISLPLSTIAYQSSNMFVSGNVWSMPSKSFGFVNLAEKRRVRELFGELVVLILIALVVFRKLFRKYSWLKFQNYYKSRSSSGCQSLPKKLNRHLHAKKDAILSKTMTITYRLEVIARALFGWKTWISPRLINVNTLHSRDDVGRWLSSNMRKSGAYEASSFAATVYRSHHHMSAYMVVFPMRDKIFSMKLFLIAFCRKSYNWRS